MNENHARHFDGVLTYLGIADPDVRTEILRSWTGYDKDLSASGQADELIKFALQWLKDNQPI